MELNRTFANPEEITSFSSFGLHPEINEALAKLGFSAPTPVQISTFQKIMQNEDLIVMAQTGTGKTAAFGIPLAERLDPKRKDVQALVLAPTRELALQVSKELNAIGNGHGIRCVPVYGGASFTKQISEVEDGAQIISGTPGRVLDHIRRKTISFENLKILVIDEADEMLSMGFEKEISEILDALPRARQNLLFSATIPDDIRRLTTRYMDEATIISVSGDEVGAKEVSHFVYLVSGQGRPRDILKVLDAERPDSAIIFCNTRDETQLVAKTLQKAGLNADWLNSDLSQNDRERVLTKTRNGKVKYLVATDVAARGIDVSHLSHVINYSFPESLETYVHRTGRTGRMGRTGVAISLITPQDIGNLYYLRLTYKIYPTEKTIENDASLARALELDKLDALRKTFQNVAGSEYISLARRLMQDVHGERILAGLLSTFFENNALQSPSIGKDDANSKQPVETGTDDATPAPTSPKRQVADKQQQDEPVPTSRVNVSVATGDDSEQKPEVKAETQAETLREEPFSTTPPPQWSSEDDLHSPEDEERSDSEIYVDAGRKDGLRISHLMKEIVRLTGLPRSALGKVRMLTRSTFISVSEEHFKTVQDAVSHIELDGRQLKAEPNEEP